MKSYILSTNYQKDWKLITLQIGSNDQCAACGSNANYVTAEAYGNYVEAAIERIKAEIPKTVVNLRKLLDEYHCKKQMFIYEINSWHFQGIRCLPTICQ